MNIIKSRICCSALGQGVGVSRVCEHIALAILDCALNVVAGLNCKSGCDRTGLLYALRAAVAMMWETRPDERMLVRAMSMMFPCERELAENLTVILRLAEPNWLVSTYKLCTLRVKCSQPKRISQPKLKPKCSVKRVDQ
jgi:hypothetical protein